MVSSKLSKKARKALRKAGGASGSDRTMFLLTGLALLAIFIFGFASFFLGGFTPDNQGLLSVGSQAPDFSTDTVNGGKVSLQTSS